MEQNLQRNLKLWPGSIHVWYIHPTWKIKVLWKRNFLRTWKWSSPFLIKSKCTSIYLTIIENNYWQSKLLKFAKVLTWEFLMVGPMVTPWEDHEKTTTKWMAESLPLWITHEIQHDIQYCVNSLISITQK
jgi:hypothetical protein